MRFERSAARGQSFLPSLGRDTYAYTGVLVGYIEPGQDRDGTIVGASRIQADPSMRDKRFKVTLNQFYVHSYPGLGRHRILCEFGGRNQVADEVEEMKFALTVEAHDGQDGGVFGKPIFMGVTIGPDGLGFRGKTVNVRSEADDMVLDALSGEAFRQGLGLVSSVQPALKPFVGLAASVVRATLKRRKNKLVFEFDIGLDFTTTGTGARLRKGSYIIVQHDGQDMNWSRLVYDRDSRLVVRKDGERVPLALNYLVIGIDDHHGDAPTPTPTPKRGKPAKP